MTNSWSLNTSETFIYGSYIIIIVDCKHWRIDTCTQALSLSKSELHVLCWFAYIDAQLSFASFEDLIWSHQPARCCGAHLNVVGSSRFAQEHGVESGDFIDSHVRQFKNFGNFMHRRNWKPTVLTLGEVQDWDHGTTLVSFGINVKDGFDSLKS